MPLTFSEPDATSIPLHIAPNDGFAAWSAGQPDRVRAWLSATGFSGGLGSIALVPGGDGGIGAAVAGIGTAAERSRGRFALAAAQATLPQGTYRIEGGWCGLDPEAEALGWLLSRHRFGRYKKAKPAGAELVAPAGIDTARIETVAAGEALTRDLINTPASDMGPEELEQAANVLARAFAAGFELVSGDDLLAQNLPMIHAVGRAAARAPRLLDLRWGSEGPALTLVGKGVCFDSGGLNIKPGSSMGLMKKDMGGAATVLGLARMIMGLGLRLRLRVLIPAVENAIGGSAMRPGDVLTSRKGLTVEINNTDAEGRLVLADALALADEERPDLLISMATLTGAARVAVGPDLAPFYATEPALADAIRAGGAAAADPVWQMPYHEPYEAMIEPEIADLDNAPKGGLAGSVTAALFLRRFVTDTPRYAHFDIYGWQPKAAAGRPVGGAGQGARAVLAALPGLLGL
ncbi:MAG: leucyl aminopeptidase family protein [Rhodobacteraceae bacterium]|nr:leucyl aminopeptidase family protein [Paracoccaceae bacterium]